MNEFAHVMSDACVVLLDFQKAFDQVDRDYLRVALVNAGFDTSIIQLFDCLYADTGAMVQVNGYLSDIFPTTRSTRQGCSASPSLWLIFMEPMAALLRLYAIGDGIRRALCPGFPALPPLVSAFFADDTGLFARDVEAANRQLSIVIHFGLFSGTKINEKKSKLIPLGDAASRACTIASVTDVANRYKYGGPKQPRRPSHIRSRNLPAHAIIHLLKIPWLKDGEAINYLGVMLGYNIDAVLADMWDKKVSTMRQRFGQWSTIPKTMISRVIVTKTMVLSLLWYLVGFLVIPSDIRTQISAACAKFLWSKPQSTWHKVSGGFVGSISMRTTALSLADGGVDAWLSEDMMAAFRLSWLFRVLVAKEDALHWTLPIRDRLLRLVRAPYSGDHSRSLLSFGFTTTSSSREYSIPARQVEAILFSRIKVSWVDDADLAGILPLFWTTAMRDWIRLAATINVDPRVAPVYAAVSFLRRNRPQSPLFYQAILHYVDTLHSLSIRDLRKIISAGMVPVSGGHASSLALMSVADCTQMLPRPFHELLPQLQLITTIRVPPPQLSPHSLWHAFHPPAAFPFPWKRIWTVRGVIPAVRDVIYQALHNVLPTATHYARVLQTTFTRPCRDDVTHPTRSGIVDPGCHNCHSPRLALFHPGDSDCVYHVKDTPAHVLLHCPKGAQMVWETFFTTYMALLLGNHFHWSNIIQNVPQRVLDLWLLSGFFSLPASWTHIDPHLLVPSAYAPYHPGIPPDIDAYPLTAIQVPTVYLQRPHVIRAFVVEMMRSLLLQAIWEGYRRSRASISFPERTPESLPVPWVLSVWQSRVCCALQLIWTRSPSHGVLSSLPPSTPLPGSATARVPTLRDTLLRCSRAELIQWLPQLILTTDPTSPTCSFHPPLR